MDYSYNFKRLCRRKLMKGKGKEEIVEHFFKPHHHGALRIAMSVRLVSWSIGSRLKSCPMSPHFPHILLWNLYIHIQVHIILHTVQLIHVPRKIHWETCLFLHKIQYTGFKLFFRTSLMGIPSVNPHLVLGGLIVWVWGQGIISSWVKSSIQLFHTEWSKHQSRLEKLRAFVSVGLIMWLHGYYFFLDTVHTSTGPVHIELGKESTLRIRSHYIWPVLSPWPCTVCTT